MEGFSSDSGGGEANEALFFCWAALSPSRQLCNRYRRTQRIFSSPESPLVTAFRRLRRLRRRAVAAAVGAVAVGAASNGAAAVGAAVAGAAVAGVAAVGAAAVGMAGVGVV